MHEFCLTNYLDDVRNTVDRALRDRLPPETDSDPSDLRQAMKHALLGGGKRLRPCLTVAACEAVGGAREAALGPACAVELVHSYSLVHDDLPAMDDDDYRRGQPTCHRKYGEASAILAGDGLLTLAFEVLAAEGTGGNGRAESMVRACVELARAAGAQGMVGGQALDLTLKHQEPDFEQLEQCHRNKTAALFAAASVLGGLAAGASDEDVDRLRRYGVDIGLAFQHADDLRDAEFSTYQDRALRRTLQLCDEAQANVVVFGKRAHALLALADLIKHRATEAIGHEAPTGN